MTPPIRLLLVDDHPVVRAGLANLLASEPGFTVVGQANDGTEGVRLWQELEPDLMLLDITMPGLDGIEVLRRIRKHSPDARVLMLTSSESAEDVAQAVKAGACGYVTKHVEHEELVAAIREAHAGGRPIDGVAERLQEHDVAGDQLSPREVEVLGLLREGFTNTEIARLLGISLRTAKAHVSAVIEKLGVIDRTQAVARGFDLGLLRATPPRRGSPPTR